MTITPTAVTTVITTVMSVHDVFVFYCLFLIDFSTDLCRAHIFFCSDIMVMSCRCAE